MQINDDDDEDNDLGGRDAVERTWDTAGTSLSSRHRHQSSSMIHQYLLVPDHPGRYCRDLPPNRQPQDHSTDLLSAAIINGLPMESYILVYRTPRFTIYRRSLLS